MNGYGPIFWTMWRTRQKVPERWPEWDIPSTGRNKPKSDSLTDKGSWITRRNDCEDTNGLRASHLRAEFSMVRILRIRIHIPELNALRIQCYVVRLPRNSKWECCLVVWTHGPTRLGALEWGECYVWKFTTNRNGKWRYMGRQ